MVIIPSSVIYGREIAHVLRQEGFEASSNERLNGPVVSVRCAGDAEVEVIELVRRVDPGARPQRSPAP